MKRLLVGLMLSVALSSAAQTAAPQGDVLGVHDLSAGGPSTLKSSGGGSCQFCHAPHSSIGGSTPLWSQTLSSQSYTLYSSPTAQNTQVQPLLGGPSSLCLSCHDGSVAVGTSTPSGTISMQGAMPKADVFGSNLQGSHPFSLKLPMKDSPDLVSSLASAHATADASRSVRLISDNIECTTCHNPHVQSIDRNAPKFLVRDNHNGGICLSCHDTAMRTVSGVANPLAGWDTSVHATASSHKVSASAGIGTYDSVAEYACQSCHLPHNALAGAGLLRTPNPVISTMDVVTQSCLGCHDGGSTVSPAAPNVASEMTKATSHPIPMGTSSHAANEAVVLQNNRHAACVDCHNPHDSLRTTNFSSAPAIRPSQNAVNGVSASDGTTIISPAVNQYENCLRCHGTSSGKKTLPGYMPIRVIGAASQYNVVAEFSNSNTSSHPVMQDPGQLPQPSLRAYMLKLDGVNASSRTLGVQSGQRLMCTDCHNSDDNREFGGEGPNGPHGSPNLHILERRYEYTQVPSGAAAGTAVTQLWQHPSLDSGVSTPGPYAMCGKCHDLTTIMTDASFRGNPSLQNRGGHFTHIDFGFSCSVCHASHGLPGQSPNITGARLVDFDSNVVAQLGTTPVSYSRDTNTCTLRCHGYDHNSNGLVVPTPPVQP